MKNLPSWPKAGFTVLSLLLASQITHVAYAQKNIPIYDAASANDLRLSVTRIDKTMRDSTVIPFWVFCKMGSGGGACNNATLPGPMLELVAGQAGAVSLMGSNMWPQEVGANDVTQPYWGHTIHLHGLDADTTNDGVPETYAAEHGGSSAALRDGFRYQAQVDDRYIGAHMYHCHVHTVKHLEMGMYSAFLIRSNTTARNLINAAGDKFDSEWNMVMSTVDPSYHTDQAALDSTLFADYNPQYFLINGEEGFDPADATNPDLRHSVTLTAAKPTHNLVIRLMGLHSTNATFRFTHKDKQGNEISLPFKLYNSDGYAHKMPKLVTEVEVSPGQTKDILLTLDTAGTFYPQVTYRDLRFNNSFTNTKGSPIVNAELTVVKN